MVFRSYTELIRKLFNAYQCGPPTGLTQPSPWSGVDHSVSRLPILTDRHFRLGFPSAPLLESLALPVKVTRRIIMQKARRHPVGLRPLVGNWFQVLFHSPVRGSFHLSLTVLCAIGLSRVFSLAGWSRPVRPGFLVSGVTQDPTRLPSTSPTGVSPSLPHTSICFESSPSCHAVVL